MGAARDDDDGLNGGVDVATDCWNDGARLSGGVASDTVLCESDPEPDAASDGGEPRPAELVRFQRAVPHGGVRLTHAHAVQELLVPGAEQRDSAVVDLVALDGDAAPLAR